MLLLCVHNSARSQMAEGFARSMAPNADVWSAGTKPTRVHPLAIEAMQEVGIDISGQASKSVEAVPVGSIDTLVTLCAESELECPQVSTEARRLHWPLPDPAQEPASIEAFRRVRDEIRWRVSLLWPHGD